MYALVVMVMMNNAPPNAETVWLFSSKRSCEQNAAAAMHGQSPLGTKVSVKCVRVVSSDPILAHAIAVLSSDDVVEPVPHPATPRQSD
jgi:hypothetical protein